MVNKFVTARNTISGAVATVPASYLTHPHFGKHLVLVDGDAKDYAPEMYQAKTAAEFEATRKASAKPKKIEEPEASETTENEE